MASGLVMGFRFYAGMGLDVGRGFCSCGCPLARSQFENVVLPLRGMVVGARTEGTRVFPNPRCDRRMPLTKSSGRATFLGSEPIKGCGKTRPELVPSFTQPRVRSMWTNAPPQACQLSTISRL